MRMVNAGQGGGAHASSDRSAPPADSIASASAAHGHTPRTLSRETLLDRTHRPGPEPFDRSIDVLVPRLRRKIEADAKRPTLIKTVRGSGYVFTPEVERE